MAKIMLSLDKRDPAFGKIEAWDYIATGLIGENSCKAVLIYLKWRLVSMSALAMVLSGLAPIEPRRSSFCSATEIEHFTRWVEAQVLF